MIYESLPFVFHRLKNVSNSVVLVVSLLISLMLDQAKSLAKRGAIMSDRSVVDKKDIDKYKIVFTSPEAVIGVERWRSTPTFSDRIAYLHRIRLTRITRFPLL